jgi:hypothetical protein
MAHRPGGHRGVARIHAQGRLAQVNWDTPGDAGRDQQHLTLAVRARQHPLHRIRRSREIDRRDLAVPVHIPLEPHRHLQEILPQQPGPLPDQQLSSGLGRQPAFRPGADRIGEVIEARSK